MMVGIIGTSGLNQFETIPILALFPRTMIVKFGSEMVLRKVKFEDAITRLQTSHENAATVGQA
jgi:hypothetical protein